MIVKKGDDVADPVWYFELTGGICPQAFGVVNTACQILSDGNVGSLDAMRVSSHLIVVGWKCDIPSSRRVS